LPKQIHAIFKVIRTFQVGSSRLYEKAEKLSFEGDARQWFSNFSNLFTSKIKAIVFLEISNLHVWVSREGIHSIPNVGVRGTLKKKENGSAGFEEAKHNVAKLVMKPWQQKCVGHSRTGHGREIATVRCFASHGNIIRCTCMVICLQVTSSDRFRGSIGQWSLPCVDWHGLDLR